MQSNDIASICKRIFNSFISGSPRCKSMGTHVYINIYDYQ